MILGLLILLSYTIIAINTRAIAKGHYIGALLTCAMFMSVNFALTKYIVEAKTWQEFVWYLAGGMTGDVLGIFIGKFFEKRYGV